MNPYSGPPDAFSAMLIGDITSSPNFIPPFPMDMPTTAVSSSDIMGWTPMENDLVANMMPGTSAPMSQMPTSTYYSPSTVNDGLMDPMLDNQQAQMMMLMMQQQQQQQQEQQQQQQFMLLQEQQQQMQLQQQQQQELQARRASQQQRLYQQQLQQQQQHQLQQLQQQQQQQQQQQHVNNQPPHWFIKQQQAKLMKQNMNNLSTPPSPVQIQSPPSLPSNKPMLDTNVVMSKRIELILTINQEIIRLCLEHQQPNLMQREPDLTLYQMKLQSNLTYLATMADISMTKPEDQLKLPAPPDLSMLPTPFTPTAHKIHRLYETAQRLFYRQPPQQQQQQAQLQQLQPQDEPSMSPHPQQLMMQQQQQQQQQMLPSDFNKMMMMQQQQQLLQQQQQQQQGNFMVNSLSGGGGGGSISSNSSSINNYMYPNTTQMMMMTPPRF